MANKRISVAVATYNRAQIIAETLAHILCQTSPPDGIVVVDDGSADDTQAVVEHLDPRIRYKKIENVGPGAARFSHAQTDHKTTHSH